MQPTALPSVLAGQQLEHVATVAKRRTGKKPSPPTIWRWCRKGVAGGRVKLAAVFHSGYWQTTDSAFDQFLADQTHAALSSVDDDQDAELIAAGLLEPAGK